MLCLKSLFSVFEIGLSQTVYRFVDYASKNTEAKFYCQWNRCAFRQCHQLVKNLHVKMNVPYHYNDIIMGVIASQITSPTIVYSTVYSDINQENIKAPRHWPLCGEFTVTGEIPAQMASNALYYIQYGWMHHYEWHCNQNKTKHIMCIIHGLYCMYLEV